MDKQADNGVAEQPKLLFSTEETITDWAVDYFDNFTCTVYNGYTGEKTLTWSVVDGKVVDHNSVVAEVEVQRAYKAYLEVELARLIVGEELL